MFHHGRGSHIRSIYQIINIGDVKDFVTELALQCTYFWESRLPKNRKSDVLREHICRN